MSSPAALGAIAALVCVALLLPFADLDPTRGVTVSNSPFSDEGANIVNARNLVLFGRWATDDWNLHLLTGPFALAEAAVFSLLGIGLVQARLVSIACVALTTALLASVLARAHGRLPASIAALAFATSTLTLFYGRLAYVETLAGLFLLVGLLTLLVAERAPTRIGGVGGIALGAAIATKAVVVPAVGATILVAAILSPRQPWTRRWLVGACAGLAVVLVIWGGVVWIPYGRELMAMVAVLPRLHVDPSAHGVADALAYFVGRGDDGVIVSSVTLLVVALLGVVAVAARRAALDPSAVFHVAAATAVAVTLVSLSVVAYHPNRYVVPMLPLAAALAAPAVPWLASLRPRFRTLAPLVVAAAVAAPGLVAHAGWMAAATRILPAVQDAARSSLPADAVVAGQYSPIVALETRAKTIDVCCGAGVVNGGDLYSERGARYVITAADPPGWTPAPADVMARAETLFCFEWGQPARPSCLLRLP